MIRDDLELDDAIEFPNGRGFTPCTREYADLVAKLNAIKPDDVNMDDLSPADYEEWNCLDNQRVRMQMEGHVGKSVLYQNK